MVTHRLIHSQHYGNPKALLAFSKNNLHMLESQTSQLQVLEASLPKFQSPISEVPLSFTLIGLITLFIYTAFVEANCPMVVNGCEHRYAGHRTNYCEKSPIRGGWKVTMSIINDIKLSRNQNSLSQLYNHFNFNLLLFS